MNLNLLANTAARVLCVFIVNALTVVGGASIIDPSISPATAALLACLSSVATVLQRLASAFLDDGKLDAEEINNAFVGVTKKPNS